MNWWFGELSALVPARLRRALKPVSRTIAVAVSGDRVSLSRIDDGVSEQIGQFSLDGDKFVTAPSDIGRLLTQYPANQWRWGLYLGNEAVLADILRLPIAARENYFEAVEFQLDRQTPFQRNEVYFDCRPVAADIAEGSFGVEYIVAPRPKVDAVLTRLTAIGIPIDFVTVATDLPGTELPFNLMPDHDPPHRYRGHKLNAALVALVILLGGAAVFLSLDHDQRHAAALSEQVDQLRTEARAGSQLLDALSAEDRNVNSVLDLKRNHVSISQVLNDLSVLLPDDTWVSRFSYKGGTAQIVVHAPESASIVGLIEGSEQFSGAKMMTAVRRLKNENRERFTLGFSTKMEEKP